MAAIVFQTDKRSGITYAYRSISYWNKEKKQSRAKRTLIGRVDKETGEIISTDGRNRKINDDTLRVKRGSKAVEVVRRFFYGSTYLLDAIGEKLGVTQDLKQCFPDTYRQILSIAYYMIIEDRTPLTVLRNGVSCTSIRMVLLSPRSVAANCSPVSPRRGNNSSSFFRGREGWRRNSATDTTTLSSYSETLKQVQYGHNKEHDLLPQLNLALVFGQSQTYRSTTENSQAIFLCQYSPPSARRTG